MSSSFLYVITFWASLQTDNLLWKILNACLIATSYFCDINNNKYYDEIDYLCILFISLCYLNFLVANNILVISALYEWYSKQTLTVTKNIAFGIALIKCIIQCFMKDTFVFLTLVCFSIIGVTVYKIRLVHCERQFDIIFYNLLTLVWRVCSLFILISASYSLEN